MHGCFQQNYQWCEGLNTFKHQLSLEEFHVIKPYYRYYALPQSLNQERLEMESAANPSTLLSIDFSKRTFKKYLKIGNQNLSFVLKAFSRPNSHPFPSTRDSFNSTQASTQFT